jgi:SAM-dependent methyltransferase
MVNILCNICSGNRSELIYEVSDYWLKNSTKKYQYYYCYTCGVIFRNPIMEELDFNSIYPSSYEVYTQHNSKKKIDRILFEYGFLKKYKIFSKFLDKGSILDIGCSDGAFLNSLKKYKSWLLFGVEKNKKIPRSNQNLNGINLFYGDLLQANYKNDQFDIVTMWDVLEHLEEPIETLQEIWRILRKEGLLILKVPNSHSLDRKIFKKYWAGIDAPRHVYVFNKDNIGILLSKFDFDFLIVRTQFGGYLNFLKSVLFFINDKQYYSERKRKLLEKFLKTPLLRILTYPIFEFINLLGYGSSLVVVAKKN